MKSWIKKILILLKTLFKYGFAAFKKRLNYFRNCDQCSLEDIQSIHIVPEEELRKQRQEKFSKPTKFSIITPLYNTPEKFLKELVESVQNQTYSNWELCLADGSDSEHERVGKLCVKYMQNDSRIVYHKLNENKGISENTNECIKLASGQYYALLDHDDLLHPSALYEVNKVINEYNADFIYTDEVKFSDTIYNIVDLKQFNFKPGFGKDDLRSHNYICHLTVFNKNLLEGEDEFYRPAYDGSQDHDMVLRLTEKAMHIYHINKILYYWRVHSNSVSMNLDVKGYAVDAAIRAVEDQLRRNREIGTVESSVPFRTLYRVSYTLIGQPKVSIILFGAKSEKSLIRSIKLIKKSTLYRNYELICIIDSDMNHNFGFENIIYLNKAGNLAETINNAIAKTTGNHIVLLNGNLKFLTQTWVEELLMHSQRKEIGTVGSKVYNQDSSIQCGGLSLSNEFRDKIYHLGKNNYKNDIGYEAIMCHVRNVTSNSMTCMMFKKCLWENVNGFTEKASGYYDVDFNLKLIEKGYRNIWTPYSEIFLSHRIDEGRSETQIKVFTEKWDKYIDNDRYINDLWNKLRLV